MSSKWVSRIGSSRPERPLLVLFPHAGSGPSVYQRWRSVAPLEVEILAVRLPGRETRIREALIPDLGTLVAQTADGLAEILHGRRFAFFGHSVGALVAYELALLRRRQGLPGPVCLGVSGYPSPQVRIPDPLHEEPDDTLLGFLLERRYVPQTLLAQQGFLEMFLPILRADFALAGGYRLRDERRLSCPIHAFAADADPFAAPHELEGWAELTESEFSLDLFPGDHFYLFDSGSAILQKVTKPLL
ncbi:thioesterase II family protein [Streptomyces sp. NPDC056948]|uniref:thioesterase II family protein n=1 Tax=Streptomyces sp. NPDC056948 TaxID=3345975 RepID=UPI00363C9F3D